MDIVIIEVNQDIKHFVDSLNEERIYANIVAWGCSMGLETNKRKAVKAIKAGAKEYITLPPDKEMIAAVFKAIVQSDF